MNLSEIKIREYLQDFCADMPIIIYNSIDSTNTAAKRHADSESTECAVFIANEQTNGRGRMGRSFISECNKGLYLSILLDKKYAKSTALTTYMAVIASEAIDKIADTKTEIKWVNDIYLGGKKLSGILTEGRMDDDGSLAYAVCGIGINILSQNFDSDVKNIATSIEDETGMQADINELAAEIIKRFFSNLSLVGSRDIVAKYKRRSFLIGKSVNVIRADSTYPATVLDITDECELLVRRDDGETEYLFTGEVSLKVK